MIALIATPNSTVVRPAYVASPTLAIPLYAKPWGTYSPITDWKVARLKSPGFAVLSQPHDKFVVTKRLGFLTFQDRTRLMRIASYIPELRKQMPA